MYRKSRFFGFSKFWQFLKMCQNVVKCLQNCLKIRYQVILGSFKDIWVHFETFSKMAKKVLRKIGKIHKKPAIFNLYLSEKNKIDV
jgi:hypothetical protein